MCRATPLKSMADISAARQAASYVLGRCRRFEAWSGQTIQSAIAKFHLDERDAALCTALCRCVLQNAAYCDFLIGSYCTQNIKRLQPQVLDILRLGTVQLLYMDRIPASAAVNESVEQCRRINPKAKGLVNAVLRRISENLSSLPEVPGVGSAEYLSVHTSHPLWLCEKMIALHGYDFALAYLSANNTEPGVTVTVNPLRVGGEAHSEPLQGSGAVDSRKGFREGEFFVQDAAAAACVFHAAPAPGMRVLDGCAAPGGKSFLAAMLMEDKGEILSCDLHAKKLALIEESAARLGISIIRTAPMDASAPPSALYEGFDLVFADVPCSGLGVIRRKPEIRYKDPDELSRLPEKQLAILTGLSRCVKKGGALHYSTCTILPEENEELVTAFLRDNRNFVREDEKTFWPHLDGTDGFYFCRIKRND